jgi:acetyl esterase
MGTRWTEETLRIEGAPALPVRIHRTDSPAAPLVLHLHGGAFLGSLESGRAVSTLLADAGAEVVSADYPTGHDNPFPCALQAVYSALSWAYRSCAFGKNRKFIIAGEDAGGNLAAGLALMARDQQVPPLAGQILLSPMLDPCLATRSIRQADAGSVGCKWAEGWHHYLGSADKASHPYAAPLGSSRLAGLPPALILTADDDPMRDESLSYARRLRDSGVDVEDHVLPGPTDWPDALHRPVRAELPWVAAVRALFAGFFAKTMHPVRV